MPFVPEQTIDDLHKCLKEASKDKSILGPTLLLDVQKATFQEIFDNTFLPLKNLHADRYNEYVASSAKEFNQIRPNDFIYIEPLAEGKYGRFVHVVKKTTGKHYAMKIQYKKNLLRQHSKNLANVDNEKAFLQNCQHPFVLGMDYAFHTDDHAIILRNHVTTGTLKDAIKATPDGRLDEDRVRFYAAELVQVLTFLHEAGLMYRNLDTMNVMVGTDGHIQLSDMGAVADSTGNMAARKIRRHGAPAPAATISPARAAFRRLSVMASLGSMAPEMELLELEFPPYVSEAAAAFVSGLLCRDGDKRLGTGPTGKADIRSHAFMEGVQWDLMETKQVEPPFIPTAPELSEKPGYRSFEAMMESFAEADGKQEEGPDSLLMGKNDDQRPFAEWRYISPQTLKLEMGLSSVVFERDATYKIVQLTGQPLLSPSGTKRHNFLPKKKTSKTSDKP
eukprot:jgi/Undpi1/8521/HiC_scaffold_25.g10988.m1